MEKSETIKNTIEKLKQSPLFNLSLASKELFHSNFLYWLGENINTKNIFQDIIKSWAGESHNIDWGKAKIRREFLNLDICITDGDNGQILLVIENKVKSIPYIAQLREYEAKVEEYNKKFVKKRKLESKVKHILLSLSDIFPEKEEIAKNWKVISYKDLASDINSANTTDYYYKLLIEDYCNYISLLHDINECWKIEDSSSYYYVDKEEKDVRIHDLCRKNRYAQMLQSLREMFGEREVAYKMRIADIWKYIDENPIKIKSTLFLDFGITRSVGFLEVKVALDTNTLIVIQIQKEHYRHAIEVRNKTRAEQIRAGEDIAINKLQYFRNKNSKWQLADDCKLDSKIYPTNEAEINFNKYGDLFFYQSRKIKTDVKVGDLLLLIKSDITATLKHR